jgi:plasmid maintenance system antidote protein VapI
MLEAHRIGEEMTLRAMGELLGISRQKLHDIEKGRRSVGVKMAANFARSLGLHEGHWVKVALEEQLRAAGLEKTVKVDAA